LQESQEKFYACLSQEDFIGLIEVVQWLRESISCQNATFHGRNIIEMGIIPHLLNLLSKKFSKMGSLQTEIAWLLANISAGDSDETKYLVELNIIPVIMDAFRDIYNDDLHENIMWILANISGESNLVYRDQILEGTVSLFAKELTKSPKKIMYYRTAAWLIANLVRGTPYPPYEKVEKIFPVLTQLVDYRDDIIQGHTLLSLVYLSEEAQENHIKSINENNLTQKVVGLINSKDEKNTISAVKVIGNLAKRNKYFAYVVISNNYLSLIFVEEL